MYMGGENNFIVLRNVSHVLSGGIGIFTLYVPVPLFQVNPWFFDVITNSAISKDMSDVFTPEVMVICFQ